MGNKTMTDEQPGPERKWEFSETLSSPGNGDAIFIPGDVVNIFLALNITNGSGKVQISLDSVDNVKAGTAIWEDWPLMNPLI